MKKKAGLITVFIFILTCFAAMVLVTAAIPNRSPLVIVRGVHVPGCDLSGLTREEADKRLLAMEQDLILSAPVVLRYENRVWSFPAGQAGVTLDRQKILDEALAVARQGNFIQRLIQGRKARLEGVRLTLHINVDQARLNEKLRPVAEEIAIPPTDAGLRIEPGDVVTIVPSQDGYIIDKEKVSRDLAEIFKNLDELPEVNISLIKAGPERTDLDMQKMGVNKLLSAFTTSFDAGDSGRSFNISVSAAALDGVLIPPGEMFSFNDTIGPRVSETGYRSAKVIINNEYVDGLGGGVCQVSSTLYNAVLLANLEVLNRSSHSLPVYYVQPGRDATVAFNYQDFCFRNNTPYYLFLKTTVGSGRVTVKIYGNAACRKNVLIRTTLIETIPPKEVYIQDPELEVGEIVEKRKGNPGMRVKTERLVLDEGGGIAGVEVMPESYYNPLNQVYITGPEAKP